MSDQELRLPPPNFEFLVLSLRMQAEVQMGISPFGAEDDADLRLARHTIDLLAMLQDKTRNNLSLEEQRLLDNTVTELRFRYVQAFEESKKQPEKEAAAASEPETGSNG
jgi:hypothetical protein